ncbi:MAG: GatB/YqeY domain-containing protein [Anaerolineales bacterium]|nr:GatB/YqeY domain-containing protein [Anaerolineales bacterium]
MSLKDQLNADLKTAMRANDEVRKTALRQLLAGIRQAELERRTAVARQRARGGQLDAAQLADLENLSLDEAEMVAVIQKEAKSRRESMVDAEKAGRADLMAANTAELRVIESYLPQQLGREALVALAQAAIAEAGAKDPKQLGAVMKLLTPRTKGLADGRLVSEVVRELLSRES